MTASGENHLTKMTSTLSAVKMNSILMTNLMMNRNGVDSDLVFICGEQEVAYPREILSFVFPLLGELVPRTRDCCDLFTRKEEPKFTLLWMVWKRTHLRELWGTLGRWHTYSIGRYFF